jgi:hypothetical protein
MKKNYNAIKIHLGVEFFNNISNGQGWIGPGTLRNVVLVKFLTTGTPFRYSLGPFRIFFFLSQRKPLEVGQIFRMSGELEETVVYQFVSLFPNQFTTVRLSTSSGT